MFLIPIEISIGIVPEQQQPTDTEDNGANLVVDAAFHSSTLEMATAETENDVDPLALPVTSAAIHTANASFSTTITNTSSTGTNLSVMAPSSSQETAEENDNTMHLKLSSRKQKRKEKHRDKRTDGSNEIDGCEKSINREHKRKRKKKQHQMHEEANDAIPKIKIKFKTLPLPGEVTPEAHFFYLPANMVRSAEEVSRPTSVETVEEINSQNATMISVPKPDPVPEDSLTANNIPIDTTPLTNKRKNSKPTSRKSRSRKLSSKQRRVTVGRPQKPVVYQPIQSLMCCVCQASGSTTNAVTCDECRRHYHFTCLEPPLKKSPKIRGYSWHCADCDPTDIEKI